MRKLKGNENRLRLCVYRSNRHIYAQLINDVEGKVLAGVSTLSPDIKSKKLKSNSESAREIGRMIAEKATSKKVSRIVFDRGRFKYHGLVKEVAEGAREGGLEF